jgi:hypothetical protein
MANITKRLRPRNTRTTGDEMKVHLHEVRLGPTLYRVVTLRPGTDAAFSTNLFHGTWHILSDPPGARLLARILWGLAYQRQPNTLFLIHGEHLKPTPFDADPSDPVLLVPAHLTPYDPAAFRSLKERLPRLGPPTRTVRWHTPGLDNALDQGARYHQGEEASWLWSARDQGPWTRERMSRCGGFLCYSAPPAILRYQAVCIHEMGGNRGPMSYHYLAEGPRHWYRWWYGEGEVQIFPAYRQQLSQAAVARREVLVELEDENIDPESLRARVWTRKEEVARRRALRRG